MSASDTTNWTMIRDAAEGRADAREAFARLYEPVARADPDRRGGFRAFLYGIVRNVARRFEERRGRGRERQPPSSYDPYGAEAECQRLLEHLSAWKIPPRPREDGSPPEPGSREVTMSDPLDDAIRMAYGTQAAGDAPSILARIEARAQYDAGAAVFEKIPNPTDELARFRAETEALLESD